MPQDPTICERNQKNHTACSEQAPGDPGVCKTPFDRKKPSTESSSGRREDKEQSAYNSALPGD